MTKNERRMAYKARLLDDAAESVRASEDSEDDRFGLTYDESRVLREEVADRLYRMAVRSTPRMKD